MGILHFHMFLALFPGQEHITIYSGQGPLPGAYHNIRWAQSQSIYTRLSHCGDAGDVIFEIILAALEYTLARSHSPRCISGPPRVFQPIYINILCPPSIVFFIIYATQARIFSFSFIVLILKKGSSN